MPANSRARQKAARAALSAKRGDQKIVDAKGRARPTSKSMSDLELDMTGSTGRKAKSHPVTKH